jgi:PQQ-dependent dehydrogenase (methanol/ethanol family)
VPGDPSKPFENRAMEAAAKTWTGQWWKYGGGGSVWDGLAYDPVANLLYVGTGNATPWPAISRESTGDADNLYTCSILAINPDNGELKWHYQSVPRDEWDYDATAQMILADLTIAGAPRKVIMQAHKNGFFYVLDRITGAFISAEPFTKVSWASRIDPKTGRPVVNPEARYTTAPVTVAPSGGGAHTWTPMSFNPATGLVYFAANLGGTFAYQTITPFQFTPGVMNLGVTLGRGRGEPVPPGPAPPMVGPEGQGAYLVAWDPVTQKERWRQPGGGFGGGGTLSTAGDLVFQALGDGRLVAYAAATGELKFEAPLSGRGMGPPISYAAGGRQYIAVLTPGPPTVHALVLDGTKITR